MPARPPRPPTKGLRTPPRNLEQTLCAYGLPAGPYVVLPLFGPATVRDAVARIGTNVAYFQALGLNIYLPYRVTDVGLQYAEQRERIRALDALSPDPYSAQRNAYLTLRAECAAPGVANRPAAR